MSFDIDSWPEFVYRFVEHYRWEPQQLGPDVNSFYTKIRRQEVPLNFLFNMLLYALPESYRRSLLSTSGAVDHLGSPLIVRNSRDRSFIQADVELDSDTERVLIELKVNAKTDLDQLQKYVMFHALLSSNDTSPRLPILLFITKRPFIKHWKPSMPSIYSEEDIGPLLLKTELSAKLMGKEELKMVLQSYRRMCERLVLGFMTWQEIGDQLADFLRNSHELSNSLVQGFLSDLERRELWRS